MLRSPLVMCISADANIFLFFFHYYPFYIAKKNSTGLGLDEKHSIYTGETSNSHAYTFTRTTTKNTSLHTTYADLQTGIQPVVSSNKKNLRQVKHLTFPKSYSRAGWGVPPMTVMDRGVAKIRLIWLTRAHAQQIF